MPTASDPVSAPVMHAARRLALPAVCLLVALTGCQRGQNGTAPAEGPPVIPVSRPVQRVVTDYVEYTGRTAAVNALDVKPRATGYIVRIAFKEGAELKKGDLLFEIDPRPYQAQFAAAKAQVTLNEANYRLAKANYARSRTIASRDPGAISREELETYQATEAQASAALEVARANLATAQLNLDFTHVTSPIDGHVSRYYYTLGNLAVQDQTLLTTVVSVDPMYAYFEVEERTRLRVVRAINAGQMVGRDKATIPVLLGLEGEVGYPHQGTLDFANNTVNPATGTIALRGTFANPKPPNGRRLLMPGMFVRVQVPIGQPHPALLVIDRAIGSDQGLKFVYVVGADQTVQYRRVETGPLQDDGLRVIETGLKADDQVVVGGLPQIRPRMAIEPEPGPMPTLAGGPTGPAGGPQPPPAGAARPAGTGRQ